jgi:hypothetical protein
MWQLRASILISYFHSVYLDQFYTNYIVIQLYTPIISILIAGIIVYNLIIISTLSIYLFNKSIDLRNMYFVNQK